MPMSINPLQAQLEQQLRLNIELRAELDDCRLAAAAASPLPLAAWQLSQVQIALAAMPEATPATLHLPPASTAPGWLARLQLAWVQLGQGHGAAAATLQAELQDHLRGADKAGAAGLDLLNRVLASQVWLAGSTTPPPAEHSALNSAGLRLALDQLALSSCGQALCLSGWCIDPAYQLAALVLLRGGQALSVPLAALQRFQRTDLAPMLEEQGLAAHWPAGFNLAMALPPAANPGEAPVLFVLLHNGEQFCLSRPISPRPICWTELLASPLPWPLPGDLAGLLQNATG